jgi:diguanylate cyclase (GGDEF)-like protein
VSKWYRYSPGVGLVAVVVVIVTLSLLYRWIAFDALIENETRSNVALTKAFANSIWRNHAEFVQRAAGLPRDTLAARQEIRDLDAALKRLARGVDVVKIKIYDLNGLTVFSTDTRQIGQDKSANPGFRRALSGAAASEITYRERFDAWEGEISERNIIATYVPVRTVDAGPVEAVLEVYSDVTHLIAKMERTQWHIVSGVVGAISVLYLIILLLARRAYLLAQQRESERRANEERIRYLAYHDALTGLPNRTSFAERLVEAVRRAKRGASQFAVMFLDLDRFKLINDSLGHDSGDVLLHVAASRIQKCIRESDMLFRMGGDEFTVLLENLQDAEEAAHIATRMIDAIAEPIQLPQQDVAITVSIGIALYPRDAEGGEPLVKSADTAMYRAKELGRNRYAFFAPEMNERVESQMRLEAGLRRALKNGEFALHYQPRVSATTQRVVGVEALLRWNHPEFGVVLPRRFVPSLEESGLIVPVGAWVLRAACEQNKAWQDAGLPPFRVSVNISPRQFKSESLVDAVRDALHASGLAPEFLEIELTESLLVDNSPAAIATMARLKEIGVAISIDDFGAGYSSLNYLKRFPVDCLKIDGSFIRDLASGGKDAAIVEAVAALARSLGMGMVAEGVEQIEQVEFLRHSRCTELQGFYFSRPVPPAAVPEIVERLATPPLTAVVTA